MERCLRQLRRCRSIPPNWMPYPDQTSTVAPVARTKNGFMGFDRGNPARRCTPHTKNGEQYLHWARRGTNVCDFHGAKAPQVKRTARIRLEMAACSLSDSSTSPCCAYFYGNPVGNSPCRCIWQPFGELAPQHYSGPKTSQDENRAYEPSRKSRSARSLGTYKRLVVSR